MKYLLLTLLLFLVGCGNINVKQATFDDFNKKSSIEGIKLGVEPNEWWLLKSKNPEQIIFSNLDVSKYVIVDVTGEQLKQINEVLSE